MTSWASELKAKAEKEKSDRVRLIGIVGILILRLMLADGS
jgi:predicted tellurium resistance membrane protein TerC